MSVEQGPTARRVRRPAWNDTRLLVGMALVLLSVAGVARLVASVQETTPVYAAGEVLVPGTRVAPEDLVVVDVRLEGSAGRYVDAGQEWPGQLYALRTVGAGELLPRASLGTEREVRDRTVTVSVDPAAVAGLQVGATVDVWVSARDEEAVGERYHAPSLLLAEAVVAGLPQERGALGVGASSAAVQVVVPQQEVAAVIAAVDQGGKVTLVPGAGATG